MKKVLIFILMFLIALCPLYVLPTLAAGDYIIEDGVLLSFTGLTSTVTIPDDVYYIADGAFKDNTRINKLNLHKNIESIGNEAFYGCTSLKEVNGGENVNFVGAYAFYGTPYFYSKASNLITLGNVILGGNAPSDFKVSDNITMIAPYAFSENTKITSFTSSNSLRVIGEGAFYRCNNLSKVSIGDEVSHIGSLAFNGTKFVADFSDNFVVVGSGYLLQYNGSEAAITIPQNVKHITGGAFYSNTHIKEVTIPSTVSSVGERAFMNCTKLTSASLSEGIVMLGKEAFARCKALKDVTIPESVELMGESVFYGCNNLKSAKLKTSADIPKGMFANCSALVYAELSHNFKSIGESAFLNCSALTDLSLSDNVTFIAVDAFEGAENLTVSCNKTSYAYEFCSDNGLSALQCGDANLDGKVNIRDATYIQKFVANIVTLSEIEALRAETNYDGKINVRDATYIQKLLAGLV